MSEDGLIWYGYQHTNGSLHTKRYFTHENIIEAKESDFVAHVVGPFEADNKEAAQEVIKELLGGVNKHEEAVSKD